MVLYAIENYLAGSDVTISSSSEDPLYILENLYNARPSKPFRFTGPGSGGAPEWVCAEFDNPKRVTLAGIFNHNLTALAAGGDELLLMADDGTCSGSPWGGPDYSHDLIPHMIDRWNDLYVLLDETRLSWYLEVIDSANPDAYAELGEWFLGQYVALADAHLQPGREESPKLYRFANVTPYGQHWTESLSRGITLNLVIKGLNDPTKVDALRAMIEDVHANNGKFVIIPDHRNPFCYYVHLENDGGFMNQVIRGSTCELTQWTIQLRTLTKGVLLI